jgi:glutathione S-transferase
MSSSYKLVYFAARGRAEAIRLAFAYGGVDFEDVRMKGPDLMAARAAGSVTPPFSQFPYLEVDGVSIGQSCSILRFVGKRTGLYPSEDVAAAKVDSVVDQIGDAATAAYGVLFSKVSDEEKAAQKEEVMKNKLPALFKGIVNYINASAGPFVFGAEPTIADMALLAFAEGFAKYGMPWTDVAPELKRPIDALLSSPKLAAYFAKREAVEAAEAASA